MPKTIICVGDSITGWHSGPMDEATRKRHVYPTYLQEVLGDNYRVVNMGEDGARSESAYDITCPYLDSPNADYFIINFGTNDIIEEMTIPGYQTALIGNLRMVTRLVSKHNKTPILMNLHYINHASEELRATDRRLKDRYNGMILELCTSERILLIDICSQIIPEHFDQEDPVHPNYAGSKVIGREAAKAIRGLEQAGRGAIAVTGRAQ